MSVNGFFRISLLSLLVAVSLSEKAAAQASDSTPANSHASEIATVKTIEWPDLIPKDDLEALLNPPDYIAEIEDGSLEDQISSQLENAFAASLDDPYQQALVSTRVMPEMDGQAVRIPGFVVPLEFSGDMVISEFFIVPYFGACIHVPPPPPNQIIHAKYAKGFTLEELYQPFWFSGVLNTSIVENDVATAAYTMNVNKLEVYTDE